MSNHFIFAQIIKQFLPELKRQNKLSPQQASTCQNILNCHTAKLGGLDYQCDHCHQHTPYYHSCRHRHCPQCGQKASEHWVAKRQQDTLPLIYYHMVFTLPHELNAWVQLHPEVIYRDLFKSVWATLNEYSQNNKLLQGQLAMVCVLHSWGQNLKLHNHLHCLIPGGVLNGKEYTACKRKYLYPHKALAKLYRGKMVSALRAAYKKGELHRITQPKQIDDVLNRVMKKDWVIHTKPHIKTPETVVKYLGRYTFRSAISLSRIRSVNNDTVRFDWLDYRDNQHKELTLNGVDFLQRFLSHVLPKGFMRIRHYGYLANCVRVKNLVKIRDSLRVKTDISAVNVRDKTKVGYNENLRSGAIEVQAPCQKCKKGRLKLVGEILSEKQRRQENALMC